MVFCQITYCFSDSFKLHSIQGFRNKNLENLAWKYPNDISALFNFRHSEMNGLRAADSSGQMIILLEHPTLRSCSLLRLLFLMFCSSFFHWRNNLFFYSYSHINRKDLGLAASDLSNLSFFYTIIWRKEKLLIRITDTTWSKIKVTCYIQTKFSTASVYLFCWNVPLWTF